MITISVGGRRGYSPAPTDRFNRSEAMPYDIDMRNFWQVNEKCMSLGDDIPRVPVRIKLVGDWICEHLGLDNARYYSDFTYQQENRLRCSEITERELGCSILPALDFGVVLDASVYGGEINYRSNATPTLRPVVNDPKDIDGLVEKMERVDLLEQGLVPKYLDWREKIRAKYGLNITYDGSIKGCATTLGQICTITNFLTWIVTDPEQIKKLIDCWFNVSKRYIETLRKATGHGGQGGLSIASDVAGMLSPATYNEFIFAAERDLYEIFAPAEDDLRYYHADSRMLHHLESLQEMGINAVNIDPYVEPKDILEKMPDVVIYGQIPPLQTLLYGTPEEVIACVKRDIEQAGPGKNLIVTTAGSINPGTSFENLKAMCYAVEKYGFIY